MPANKRSVMLLFLLVLLTPLGGCFELPSLNPLCDSTTAIAEPALVGLWQADDGSATIAIRLKGKVYQIAYVESDLDVEGFTGLLTEIGGTRVMDLQSEKSLLAEHHFMRVEVKGDRMTLSYMDSEWLRESIRKGGKPSHVVYEGGKRMLLTASTEEVRETLSQLAKDRRAFDSETHGFSRVKP
jgi:hypothetical protein